MLYSVLLLRLWQAGAGLLTALFVVRFFTPELQGWYYSFLSVAALYTLFDLGLSCVLVQVAAHEAVGLRWGAGFTWFDGRTESFTALFGSAVRWYFFLSVFFLVCVLPGGYIFFSLRADDNVHWHWPWLLLCVATAVSLATMPFLAVLEGGGLIRIVYRVRIAQAVFGSVACWAMMAYGGGLWATAMVPSMAALTALGWLVFYARALMVRVWQWRRSAYNWRREVWPLQWRVAVSWLAGYLVTQINIPILFHVGGATLAGQFGLSLAVVNTLGLVCQSWFARHVPLMAQAVVDKNWKRFDEVFARDLLQSVLVFVFGALVLLGGWLLFAQSPLVKRLLPFWTFAGLFVYAFVSLLVSAWATHLRSFRREPLLPIIVVCSLLVMPGVVVATKWYSIEGMVVVLNIVYIFVLLPISWRIWRHCNRVWREVA